MPASETISSSRQRAASLTMAQHHALGEVLAAQRPARAPEPEEAAQARRLDPFLPAVAVEACPLFFPSRPAATIFSRIGEVGHARGERRG
jgi:hypothetical protein